MSILQNLRFSQIAQQLRNITRSVLATQQRVFSAVEVEKEETIEEVRSRIFGEDRDEKTQSLRKLLGRSWDVEEIVNYYPRPIRDPLLRDLDLEKRKAKLERLRRRGKGKPPKGQGKRASGSAKKKKK